MKPSPTRRPAGFTLLEVLVALSMSAVLLLALQGTLHVARRARDSAVSKTSELRGLTYAFDALRRDLESALPPNGILAGTFLGQHVEDSLDSIALFRVESDSYNAGYTRPAGVRKVEIGVMRPGANEGSVLVRQVTRNLLSPRAVEPESQVLLRGIRSFRVRYFDGSVWLDVWDSTTQGNVLPVAAEIEIEVEGRQHRNEPAAPLRESRLFTFPCHRDPDTQQAGSKTGGQAGGGQSR